MKYSKVRGASVAECMMKIRSSCGADALILETREIKEGGVFGLGLFARKSFEIEYMLPEKNYNNNFNSNNQNNFINQNKSSYPNNFIKNKNLINTETPNYNQQNKLENYKTIYKEEILNEAKIKEETTKFQSIKDKIFAKPLLNTKPLSLQNNIDKKYFPNDSNLNINKNLENINIENINIENKLEKELAVNPIFRNKYLNNENVLINQNVKMLQNEINDNVNLEKIKNKLKNSQMSPSFASSFIKQLEETLSPREKEDYKQVERQTLKVLSQSIQIVPIKVPVNGECKAYMLIGPSGSGKTTTIAKLAARFHLVEKRSVSLYSLDHYRLAATEQLKTYANVLGISFKSPLDIEEFKENLRRDGSDIILIDSSGMSYVDEKRLEELSSYIKAASSEMYLECNLVLAANTNPLLLEKIVLAYDKVGFDKLLLTKVDEAGEFIGSFIEVADKFKRPFSFVTNGQEVPSDIHEANAKEFANMIMGI